MLKHAGCGGELKKFGKKGSRYRCSLCGHMMKMGHSLMMPSYIKRQSEKK